MIAFPAGVKVWIAGGVTDMRRGMRTLALQVQEGLGRDPHAGEIFCFRGRRGDLVKILWHDGVGVSLYRKRWAIQNPFGDAKTRGLNIEDTRLTNPAKLGLRCDLPLLGVWQIAPGVNVGADLVDDRGGIVPLPFGGESARRIELQFTLILGFAATFSRLWDGVISSGRRRHPTLGSSAGHRGRFPNGTQGIRMAN